MDSAFGRTHSDGIDHGHKAEVGSPFPTLWEEDDKPTSKDDVEIREDV